MSTIASSPARPPTRPKFYNGEEFLHSLGDVPMSRVVWDPVPGTATEQDLLLLVERDRRLCELIDGTLVEKPMGRYESFLAGWLLTYLNLFLENNPLGVVFGEAALLRLITGRVRAPDVSFFSFARLGGKAVADERISSMSADLAVEVFSDSNTDAEMRQKKGEYFSSGTRLMWIVYPIPRTVAVFDQPTDEPTRTLGENEILDGGSVLPGFTLELSKLFNKRLK
jgi:Uma2 family endonuclease